MIAGIPLQKKLMEREKKLAIGNSISTKMLLVVLGIYLLIATSVTLGHTWMDYRYQKDVIINGLSDIEDAFKNTLSVSLWSLDEEALFATVEGMIRVPTLVGVKITNDVGTVAII